MKFCFVQKQAFPYFGVMSLAGRLGAAGIATDAVIDNLERDLVAALRDGGPDIIGISCLSTEHEWLGRTAARIKEAFPDVPLIAGGIHAVLYPEAVLAVPAVDIVCTGDGEETLVAVCEARAAHRPLGSIKGIGYREGGRPVITERDGVFTEIDRYPEDRMVYYRRYRALRDDEQKQFLASRGCPYRCTFCFNQQLHRLFPGRAAQVRMKDPEFLVREIERARDAGPLRTVFFADDLFASNKAWLREFAPRYRERIGLPFMCITRADVMDEETAELLRDAGCRTVSFGIESGNEAIRTSLLRKQITDDVIVRCASLIHRKGMRVQTSNMFCLPGETLADAFATVRLNVRIRADFVFTPLFLPFPGTALAEHCIEKGYLPKDFSFRHLPQSFLGRSCLSLPDRRKIENLQRVAYFLVKYPRLLPVVGPLVEKLPFAFPFFPFLLLGTLLRYQAERGLSFRNAVRFLWRFRKSY